MIQISQVKLPANHTKEELEEKILKLLRIKREDLRTYRIAKRSLDARMKQDIRYVYTIEANTVKDQKIAKRFSGNQICYVKKKPYRFPMPGTEPLNHPPVIAGSGPAGLFCAYMLACAGYHPIVLERGKTAGQRKEDVRRFWKENALHPDSNVQFGEGGAGAFSDGKLNTFVKDPLGRGRKILEIFMDHGAPEEISYEAKPHIGTDMLAQVIPSMRQKIISLGGRFFFESCMTGLSIQNGRISSVEINHNSRMETDILVLAIGHSARDTFAMLHENQIPMEAKAFAVGLRVEHPQDMINIAQYGQAASFLPPADYKLTAKGIGMRGVYSFCMCPGGYVINASSEEGHLAINGMSNYKRDAHNANSAIIVSVSPKDFGGDGPLCGIAFQRKLEQAAWQMGEGSIPQQLYGDFKRKCNSASYGQVTPAALGKTSFGALHSLFGQEIYDSFILGMEQFGRKIKGFAREDALLSGVESRTSSPVRVLRNEDFQSSVAGLYPCGEGAGYAGGIMSAAIDGIKAAEAIACRYSQPLGRF